MRPDDSIDRAGTAAVCTADAKTLINDSHTSWHSGFLGERQDLFAQQFGESAHGLVTARWAEIDGDTIFDYRGRIRAASWIAALVTLCL